MPFRQDCPIVVYDTRSWSSMRSKIGDRSFATRKSSDSKSKDFVPNSGNPMDIQTCPKMSGQPGGCLVRTAERELLRCCGRHVGLCPLGSWLCPNRYHHGGRAAHTCTQWYTQLSQLYIWGCYVMSCKCNGNPPLQCPCILHHIALLYALYSVSECSLLHAYDI